ncbi:MAG: endonuclease/exonuclease/phosphatase family protein [Lachnospiraceae bacterium]|nr:endonuclease/exonuclease/phosphatase family protein [Lachnospiraceae bacterium]
MRNFGSTLLKILATLIAVLAVAFIVLLIVISVKEYKPEDWEQLEVASCASPEEVILPGDNLKILTWNVGCGTLGDNADFFMDYGKMVYTADVQRVGENMGGIIDSLDDIQPDIMLLQETDINSSRSYGVNERDLISTAFPAYDNTFAYNFNVAYIPYPIPPIGRVQSGLTTLSRYPISSAERIQLPCPFKWPVRCLNLKRCLSVSRIPVEGTDKQLVIVNLHLEAYDDGVGKAAQTRMLADFLQTEAAAGNYVIAGGDFNQRFSYTDASAYPEYEGKWHCGILDEVEFGQHLDFCQDPSFPTCRSLDKPLVGADRDTFQYYVIDGFIVSDNIEVISVETIDNQFKYTDHNPVVLEVSLKP